MSGYLAFVRRKHQYLVEWKELRGNWIAWVRVCFRGTTPGSGDYISHKQIDILQVLLKSRPVRSLEAELGATPVTTLAVVAAQSNKKREKKRNRQNSKSYWKRIICREWETKRKQGQRVVEPRGRREKKTGGERGRVCVPDGVLTLQTDPLRDGLVDLGGLSELKLQTERLVGRLKRNEKEPVRSA